MRVLHVSGEADPHSKTGGLGDVCGALPPAQRRAGCAAEVLTPLYGSVSRQGLERAGEVEIVLEGEPREVTLWASEGHLLADVPGLLDRTTLYGHPDDPLRFAALSKVAAELAPRYDLLHLHDWHAALTALYVRGRVPVVQSIHNLAYQGRCGFDWADRLDIPEVLRSWTGLEFHGQLNLFKAGLVLADHVSTVSPTYALEIQSEPGGQGLAGLLAHRHRSLSGILNGIDLVAWDPATDPALAKAFSAEHPEGRVANTAALRAELGLGAGPIFGVVSRAAYQKGLDLIAEAAPAAVAAGARFVVLTDGDRSIVDALRAVERRCPGSFALVDSFDPALARRIYAGADFVVVPSRFEPCGLTQLFAMRYGALPIVRRTGGLADTVTEGVDGVVFEEASGAALGEAFTRALALSPAERAALRSAGMRHEPSWDAPAAEYIDLYARLIEGRQP